MWTRFMDMHSGGGCKEKWQYIFIEAPQDEATVIFYNRFGHNPNRVSCTCSGEDYSISDYETLEEATAFERGLRCLETPKDEKGRYMNDMEWPTRGGSCYLEPGEEVPEGHTLSSFKSFRGDGPGQHLDEYMQSEDVLFIRKDEITDEERVGDVPEQGFVWQG